MAVLAAAPAAGVSPPVHSVGIEIEGLRSTKGNVLVCVTANPRAFPDCSKDATATRAQVTAADASDMRLAVSAPGNYAISVVHDENANGRLDTRLMLPREGFGFSRNPAIAFGPPSFKAARFAVGDGDAAQTIRMKYML